jgi:hypothetical protein
LNKCHSKRPSNTIPTGSDEEWLLYYTNNVNTSAVITASGYKITKVGTALQYLANGSVSTGAAVIEIADEYNLTESVK